MKCGFMTLCVLSLLVSCQKSIAPKQDLATQTVASDAVSPLKCHTISFNSNYPVNPGEVPPFKFTKTLYPDSRVKTLYMLSRKNPIHPAFKKEAIELIGTFTYGANDDPENPDLKHLAFFKGTSEVWEYYKTATGVGARRSIEKKNISWKCSIDVNGVCLRIEDITLPKNPVNGQKIIFIWNPYPEITFKYMTHKEYFSDGNEDGSKSKTKFLNLDDYGNILGQYGTSETNPVTEPGESAFSITYDYSKPRGTKNFNFIPTQNLFSQEYSFIEVMQWVPQNTHQRATASGTFMLPNHTTVTQSQAYKNYVFDAKGNLTSLTYSDNVLQKTGWNCQN